MAIMMKTPMVKAITAATLAILLMFSTARLIRAEDWPQWRGPANNGISSAAGLPAEWNQSQNVNWRYEMPGPGAATPVVWQDRIFLTSTEGENIVALCISTGGKLLWQSQLSANSWDKRDGESTGANPSACTDGEHVWFFAGTGVLGCFDFAGKEIWRSDLQNRYGKIETWWGNATSPLLAGDRLYLQLLHANAQLVIALDKKSGREIWRVERDTDARSESLQSYATPVIYQHDEKTFLISHGADYTVAHDLNDGSEIWRCGGLQKPADYNPYYRFIATPVVAPGMIIVPSAKNGPVLAIKPKGATGDITDAKQYFHWKRDDGTPDVPSPLVHDGLVYLLRENGVLYCIDAKSGAELYQNRTHNFRHRSSPVYADGKVYCIAYDGTVSVIQAGRTFKMIAQNKMDERTTASLAVADGTIYMRTYKALYAIAGK
jgi:outer membrane protein assembly factor BamB